MSNTDYDYSGSLFPPPNMFNTPPPTPNSFAPPTPPPHNSGKSSGAHIFLWTILCIGILLVVVFLVRCLGKRYLPGEESNDSDEESDDSDVDLESGLSNKKRRSNSKVSEKRQSKGSVHPLRKNSKNIDACRGHMVHGYDKRLSSSKVNAKYYNKFIKDIDAKNFYSRGDDDLTTEFDDDHLYNESSVEYRKNEANYSRQDPEYSDSDEGSSNSGDTSC